MKNYQETVLAELERIAARANLTCTVSPFYSNTGVVIAGDPANPKASFSYDFQGGSGNNKILFNGVALGPTDMSHLWRITEGEKLAAMYAKWAELVGAKA